MTAATPVADDPLQLVTFAVADELFAADVLAVERVRPAEPPRRMPHLPAWITGVIDHDGRAVPVIDLRARLGFPPGEGIAQRLIVFDLGDQWIAALVDRVLSVDAVAPSSLAPPPPLVRGLSAQYIAGLVRRGADTVVVLDATRLLTATESLALADAVAADA